MENNFLDCIILDAKVDKLSVFTFHLGGYIFYLYFFLDKNDWLKIKITVVLLHEIADKVWWK